VTCSSLLINEQWTCWAKPSFPSCFSFGCTVT